MGSLVMGMILLSSMNDSALSRDCHVKVDKDSNPFHN